MYESLGVREAKDLTRASTRSTHSIAYVPYVFQGISTAAELLSQNDQFSSQFSTDQDKYVREKHVHTLARSAPVNATHA